jgi:hypothetical protein
MNSVGCDLGMQEETEFHLFLASWFGSRKAFFRQE